MTTILNSDITVCGMDLSEQWKPVVGFEGFYEVSNLGRIRSVGRSMLCKGPNNQYVTKYKTGKMLRQQESEDGLNYVLLSVNGVRSRKSVARIVASSWCVQHEGDNYVVHLDGNSRNNIVSNLMWTSKKPGPKKKTHES